MLDEVRKKGKPVTAKMEEMAVWLDNLDVGDADGQVSLFAAQTLGTMVTAVCVSVC